MDSPEDIIRHAIKAVVVYSMQRHHMVLMLEIRCRQDQDESGEHLGEMEITRIYAPIIVNRKYMLRQE
jgi:hypothetical protein